MLLWEALALAAPGGFALTAAASYAAPELIRRRSVTVRRAVAALAAALAFTAHTQPTGLAVVDAALAPALAAAVTLLAARARPWTMAVAAGAAAAASVPSPEPLLGFAAVGAAVAAALTARRTPVLTALVGLALVNAVLRLRLPGPAVTEVFAALAVLAPVCLSGYRRLRRETQRRLRNGVFVTAVPVVAVALLGAVALALARPALEEAIRHASAGLSAARSADEERANDELEAAADSFRAAAQPLGAWWARPASAIPVVGPHLRALRVAATTGVDLAVAGERVAAATNLAGIRVSQGQVPVEGIAALEAPLVGASDDVAEALHRLRSARSPWLLPPVARRLDANVSRLADADRSLRTSRDVVAVLPRMLGAGGPRRWFLAIQTPSEARGSGGFIGNYGEIVADGGRLKLARFGRIGELNQGGDPARRVLGGPADYVARYGRFAVANTWQNVTLSPDFPSVTKVIANLYPQSGGQPIDGVIAVDPAGVAALLRLTGPLQVPPWPEPITPDNAERILLYEQYVALQGQVRLDFLGDASRLLWERLTSGDLPGAGEIVKALGPAVRGKHLLVSAVDATEDAALARAGANGAMAPVRGDALSVITQNASGNKIDWFLRRQVQYRPRVDPTTGALSAQLAITLENDAPASGLPDYLIGNALPSMPPPGTNRLYLSVYTPWGLTGARINGVPATMESERELGRSVYSTYLDVAPRAKVVLELDLEGRYPRTGGYLLDLHSQPLVTPDRVTVSLNGRAPRSVVLDRDLTLDGFGK